MKKLFALLAILSYTIILSPFYLLAQNQTEFWGMTANGGSNDGGVIFKTDSGGNNQELLHSFIAAPGTMPFYTQLCHASNGKLYGMTWKGGANDFGVLFEYDPAKSSYTKKLDFAGSTNGSYPCGSLMQASNGKLYGMTTGGGVNNIGVLFEYDPATSTYTKKLDFAGSANGREPSGSLIQASNGKLYGMTYVGGINNMGVLFEYDPATSTYSKKIDFAGTTNGRSPCGSLIQASNGKLYGMTCLGGTSDMGVIFEYDPLTFNYSKKLDFAGVTNGRSPYGEFIEAINGKLYGMTTYGGSSNFGVIFEYDPSTYTFTKKLDFAGVANGGTPYGSLMQASNGKLYGMTYQGGTNVMGVLFEYNLINDSLIKKLDFNNINGRSPLGSITQAANGKLYGMTHFGGESDMGVLFEYDIVSDTYVKKLDFGNAISDNTPFGSLMKASDGMLYGMTSKGGTSNMGVLFAFDPATDTYTKKINFSGSANGREPQSSLVQASNGKLYGLTDLGGVNNFGVLFEYDPSADIYNKKLDFAGAANGRWPIGSLMLASSGKFYGMTYSGGANNMGVLFEYNPTTNIFIVKINFAGVSNGSYPQGTLIQTADGKIYGLTSDGGTNAMGVLFEYDTSSSTCTKKVDFAGNTNGRNPFGSLVKGSNGKLYGMTYYGGTSDLGVLFEYDPATTSFTKKLDFTGAATGFYPATTLMLASNGKLYGMTENGGANAKGVLFEYDPATNSFTKKLDFDNVNGAAPLYTQLIEICVQPKFTTSIPDVSICTGENTYFVTTATGNGLTYQWQVDIGAGFTNIINGSIYSHVTDDTLHINGATLGMNSYQYRCVVSSTCPVRSIQSDTAILSVNPVYAFTENHEICNGQTYVWHGQSLTTSGTYHDDHLTTKGCDSTYTLNLTVNPVYASVTDLEICDGDTAIWQSGYYAAAGTYHSDFLTTKGCDSTFTLNLTVNPTYVISSAIEICEGDAYNWHGTDYTATGTYHADYLTIKGCDSTFTLNLTVNPTYIISSAVEICNGDTYTWQGNDYTAAGNYTETYSSIHGCDSVYELELTVDTVDISLTITDPTITADSIADAYQWIDCDNAYAPIGGANLQSYTATANGNYAVIVTQGLCSDTSACVPILTVGIASENLPGIALYPNPSNGRFTLELEEAAKVEIYNAVGSLIYNTAFEKGKHTLSLNLADGVYLLKATNDNGSRSLRVVIEK